MLYQARTAVPCAVLLVVPLEVLGHNHMDIELAVGTQAYKIVIVVVHIRNVPRYLVGAKRRVLNLLVVLNLVMYFRRTKFSVY